MTEFFQHTFHNGRSCKSRRHVNPDGSEGGIVALTAKIGTRAHVSGGASIGEGASIGSGASIGEYASIGYGVSIGTRASIGEGASIGPGASIGKYVSIGTRASIGSGVVIDKEDWWITVGPQGSRNAFATAVWSPKNGLLWWVGCQHGISTAELKERVAHRHGGTLYETEYLAVIDFVENHPGMKRARRDANEGAMK